jgi:EAL domain-containing protein (putative c-di-GMP-specific phosphodiesterase class I)
VAGDPHLLPTVLETDSMNPLALVVPDEGRNSKLPIYSLDEALRSHWVEFWYQPIFDLKTRKVLAAECFARVRHPIYGLLPPAHFLADASEYGLAALTKLALISALKSRPIFFRSLNKELRVGVNISVSALKILSIIEVLNKFAGENRAAPGIAFEITANQIVDQFDAVRKIMNRLSPEGIKFAIDDCNDDRLANVNLTDLTFSELKLGRTCIQGCDSNADTALTCQKLIDLAHAHGASVVAVGIETAAEAEILHEMGCDTGQGYLYARSMPVREFISSLAEVPQEIAKKAQRARRR